VSDRTSIGLQDDRVVPPFIAVENFVGQ